MLSLLMGRTLNSQQFCVAMWWAGKGGLREAIPYGFRPGAPSGHYSRHLDPLLGFKQHNKSLYEIDVPGHSKADLSRTQLTMPVAPVHEVMGQAFEEVGFRTRLREAVASKALPPCYFQHPTVRANPDELVAPASIYLDFVPYSQTDSLLCIWLVSVFTEQRFLFAVLRKRSICQCGCKGWCSLNALFRALVWSLKALASGKWPSARHDGGDWRPSDQWRAARAGEALPLKVACLYVKGDWAEYSYSL